MQWALMQPPERVEDGRIVKAPSVEMSWGERVASGKKGVRLFIIGLILWADQLQSVCDGSSATDWTHLAADVALVLKTRTAQVMASARDVNEGPEAAKPPSRKR